VGTSNDTSTANSNTITMSENKVVTVTFEKDAAATYILTINIPTGHGSISPAGGVCLANSTVRLTASPESGYRVRSWNGTVNDPGTGSVSNQVLMTSNRTITVEFEEISAQPTPSPSGSSGAPILEQSSQASTAAQQAITATAPMCGAGALTVLPMCLLFGLVMKLNFSHRNRNL
jgi:hypothetical protein